MPTVDLDRYLKIIWSWAWLLVLTTIMAGAASYYSLRHVPHTYVSSTTIMVGDPISSLNPNGNDYATAANLAETYSQMAESQTILEGAIKERNLNTNWQYLRAQVLVVHQVGADTFDVRVVDIDPQRAQSIASAIADQLIAASPTASYEKDLVTRRQFIKQQLDDLQTKIQQAKSDEAQQQAALAQEKSARGVLDLQDSIKAIELNLDTWQSTYATLLTNYTGGNSSPNVLSVSVPATLPVVPAGPATRSNVALSAMAGLLLSVAGVLTLEFLDDTVKSRKDLESLVPVPTLGVVRRLSFRRKDSSRLIVVHEPESAAAEEYRSIAINLNIASLGSTSSAILVTSSSPQEGKSLTAANLATALAQGGKRVLLVDMDLRNPTQHSIFKIPNQRGVSTLLLQPELRVGDCLVDTDIPQLKLLTSGAVQPAAEPSRLIPSDVLSRFGEQLLQSLRGQADFVIIDSPPVLVATDAVILSVIVDGTLLVARAGSTRRGRFRSATEALTRARARLVGTVLNGVPNDDRLYGYQYNTGRKRSGVIGFLGLGRRPASSPGS